MGLRGFKTKYADKPSESAGLTEHRLNLANDARAFTPDSGERDGEGTYSNLALYATGDWSWKPARNAQFAQNCMPAFKGVPPSAAELYGRNSYRPA